MVMDQKASTGVVVKPDGVPVASVELVAVGVGVRHRVSRLISVVAPQTSAALVVTSIPATFTCGP
jgi:hypothetical protein